MGSWFRLASFLSLFMDLELPFDDYELVFFCIPLNGYGSHIHTLNDDRHVTTFTSYDLSIGPADMYADGWV
jgi:hypothetical protein